MGISIEDYKNLIATGENKNVKRQMQGRRNHGLGKNFELQIENICQVYEMGKLAKIEKTPEPLRVLQHIENGHFDSIFTKSAQPDFKGTIKGGKTVVFDAKFTESDKITYQALSDYQRETLLQYDELGAKAFVLVGFSNGAIYNIDIKIWCNMKEIFGRKSIKQNELEDMNLKSKVTKGGVVDFLAIM